MDDAMQGMAAGPTPVTGDTAVDRFMAVVQCAAAGKVEERMLHRQILDEGWNVFFAARVGEALGFGARHVMLHLPYGRDDGIMEIDGYDECVKRWGVVRDRAMELPASLAAWRPKIDGCAFCYVGSMLGDEELDALLVGEKQGAMLMRIVRGFADILDAGWGIVIDQGGMLNAGTWRGDLLSMLHRLRPGAIGVEPLPSDGFPEACGGMPVVVHEHFYRDPRRSSRLDWAGPVWRKIHKAEAARRGEPWDAAACLRYTREVLFDGGRVASMVPLLVTAGCKTIGDLVPAAMS